ncbi:MAG: hypothetical protein ACXADH_17165 [Candidatus Kariarchaeaceae archaeon]|jgi:hypothetical protein
MDTTKFTYFVSLNPNAASFSFLAHFVDNDGEVHELVQKQDQYGNKTYRRFKWTQQNRTIRIPNKQKKVIEFLQAHPFCEGSPNGSEGGAAYKEINDSKAANIALEAKRLRSRAESIALAMDEDEIAEFAALIGSAHTDSGLRAHAVAEYAGNNPPHFIQLYEDPARAARALYAKAKKAGILKNKGFMVFWENVHLGNGDEKAIQKIFEDEQLSIAITEQLKKEGLFS